MVEMLFELQGKFYRSEKLEAFTHVLRAFHTQSDHPGIHVNTRCKQGLRGTLIQSYYYVQIDANLPCMCKPWQRLIFCHGFMHLLYQWMHALCRVTRKKRDDTVSVYVANTCSCFGANSQEFHKYHIKLNMSVEQQVDQSAS